MRTTIAIAFVVTLGGGLLAGPVVSAEQTNPSHAHIGHVMDGWRDTPEGHGLLPTAIAEAEIAAQHAALAAGSDALDGMQRHAGHVLHAVDPSQVENGPGLGYGVKKAATGAAAHIGLAAQADGASDNVKTHAEHVASAANNTVARADEMVTLAKEIQAASSADAARPKVERLNELAMALTAGVDADGDGRVGWQTGEGGLETAQQHASIMKRGEGIE